MMNKYPTIQLTESQGYLPDGKYLEYLVAVGQREGKPKLINLTEQNDKSFSVLIYSPTHGYLRGNLSIDESANKEVNFPYNHNQQQ